MNDPKATIQAYARDLGFDLVGVTSADAFERGQAAEERVAQGLMDGLPWFTVERARRASRPQELLPGAHSVIALGISYNAPHIEPPPGARPRGRVARYARGLDYHAVIKKRLRAFVDGLAERLGRGVKARFFVDDGPMLERAAAERAGIGWFGKNTNILTRTHGSWVFLAEVVTDLALDPDRPLAKTCGACQLCIVACPTGAIVRPYVLDNRRCISYLIIENRGPIPVEMRPLLGDWVFGCDICQEVCPVNRKAAPTREVAFVNPQRATLELVGLLSMTEEEYQERFRGSPIKRAGRVGLQRNACVALGNSGDASAVPPLARALKEGPPLVRGHAAWALGRLGGPEARQALRAALQQEQDPDVRGETQAALGNARASLGAAQ